MSTCNVSEATRAASARCSALSNSAAAPASRRAFCWHQRRFGFAFVQPRRLGKAPTAHSAGERPEHRSIVWPLFEGQSTEVQRILTRASELDQVRALERDGGRARVVSAVGRAIAEPGGQMIACVCWRTRVISSRRRSPAVSTPASSA